MQSDLQKPLISVVIVYTNTEQLKEAVEYLQAQTIYPYVELILLDNRNKRFTSAASALNYGAEKAFGEVVVFMHQDVYLWDAELLEKYYAILRDKPNVILGVAGVAENDCETHFDFCETRLHIYRGRPTNGEPMQAITLDECMFAMNKTLWEKLKFDEKTCDNWHFYGADICYNNLFNGGENIILSANICHESKGNVHNKQFRRTLRKIINKYKKRVKILHTTCVHIKCNMLRYFRYRIGEMYHKIFGEDNECTCNRR